MNLNFHQSLDEKCHRFLNAVEPGANIPVHRHPEKEESFVVLRGRIRVITYNDDGTIIENIVLNPSEGRYGVNVGKNVWHTVEALEPGSVIFECKEGPYVPHEEKGILTVCASPNASASSALLWYCGGTRCFFNCAFDIV